ncbi:MAG: DNA-binding protein WhiA [Candidatus Ornithomonoglobus sp.]
MSFSSDIKQILCKSGYECSECRKAELAGFFVFPGKLIGKYARISSGAAIVRQKIAECLNEEYKMAVEGNALSEADSDKLRRELCGFRPDRKCCRISYIRGAFLGGGSVSNPEKEYHLEFDAKEEEEALYLRAMLEEFGFRPKLTKRREKIVIYIKESSQIAELIGYISGGMAGLEIFSVQIEKSVKGEIQRQVNCDSANLNKQARASSKHIKAIKKIKAARKWSAMPDVLREIGELRLKYPDVSLEELGTMTKQGIGKSGVNHRLNRIMEYAEGIGEKKEESK